MDLDTPLTHYTAGWLEPAFEPFLKGDPRLNLITARRILSHTSGLPNWRSKEEPLAIAFTPGEKWSYSGEGYCYLQSSVMHLIGAQMNPNECGRFENDVQFCATVPSLNDFMKERALVPFRMASSGFFWTAKMMPHLATGHDPGGKPIEAYETTRRPTGPGLARYGVAGGLYTTPTDYAKFIIEQMHPKPTDRFRLTGASLKEMLRPQVKRNGESSWALGWEINHTENGDFIRHGGGNPGFSCLMAWSRERKSGYVIMTNTEDIGYFEVIKKLITGETLARLLGGKLRGSPE
jgi:CubicO group peptidase (beta-lactamase class C family)